jgi:hypothetical protein
MRSANLALLAACQQSASRLETPGAEFWLSPGSLLNKDAAMVSLEAGR